MATDIVGGLFGITPEMYQQKVGEDILQQGVQMGQLAPDAFGRANVYAGAAQIGRGISGVMGAQDPQLKLISARNAIFSRTDPNDPESLARAASELAPFDPQGANALATQAREAAFKLSQVTKNMRERAGAEPLQQLIRAGKYTPASVAEYANTNDISKLVEIEKVPKIEIKDLQEYRQKLIDAGAPESQIKEVDEAIKGVGKGRGTTVSVDTRQPIEISKNKTDLAAEIEKGAFTASDRITLAQNLRSLLPKAFVGVGSDVVLQGARVAEAFGIDVKGVAPSQIVDTILNEMTVGKAGELKGALSDKDREFLKATIGTRGLSIKTLNYVADEIERRASIDRKLNTRVNEAIKSKKNLNEIDFAEERSLANKDVKKDLDRLKELRLKAGQQQ
jgi:nucleotide-binding universal stress UspA family protein